MNNMGRIRALVTKWITENLLNWHPVFECITHKVRHHIDTNCTDDHDEWMTVTVMRKCHRLHSA